MSKFYAANGQVSRDPIEGGIEITRDQYLEGVEALSMGRTVRIDGGFRTEVAPQRTDYWTEDHQKHQTDPGEPVPVGAATEPPPDDFHDLIDGQWVESIERVERHCLDRIDGAASKARERFITRAVGQAAVYLTKYEEARNYQAASSPTDSDYPYLNAEAQRRGMSISDLAAEVVTRRNEWTDPPGCTIEAERVGAKADVRAAGTAQGKRDAAEAAAATLDGITP
jgi:hypothetical protein